MRGKSVVLFILCFVPVVLAFSNDFVSVVSYGANGSDALDDTSAFNAAIAYCKNNGYKTLYIPCGTYRISSSLTTLNNSFSMISIVGENASSTILDVSGISSNQPVFKTHGGSGGIANAEIASLCFKGANEEYGLEIKGTCGVKIRDCKFDDLKYGIVFSNNISAGTFTEYCVAEKCCFYTETAIYYERGNGDASFHGSGLRGCTVNNRSSNITPVIKIGEDTKPTIHLYNAPMDFQVWVREDINIIEGNVSPSSRITTYGTITMELFGGSPKVAKSGAPVYHHGNILSWDSNLSFGDIQLVDWSATNADGSINVSRRPFSISKTLNTAATTIPESASTMLGSLITVGLVASNYDYRYLLFITHNGYGDNGTVTVLSNPRSFNSAGLGAPSFSVNSLGQLVIANSSYASTAVTARFHVTPMGQRNGYFIGD